MTFDKKNSENIHDITPHESLQESIHEIYTVKRLIGIGNFSQVYMAVKKDTKETVAIKKILNTPVWSTEDEVLKVLDHPNILKFVDSYPGQNHRYLVTEYVDGKELRDVIIDSGRFEDSRAKKIFRQILDAIEYIHSEGYAHRDVKLENIILNTESDHVKLVDFGFAMTENGECIRSGSVEYASPELLSSRTFEYKPSDVWAMGICLYVILYGAYPFQRTSEYKVTMTYDTPPAKDMKEPNYDIVPAILKTEPVYKNFVSNDANELIMAMLVKDPVKRVRITEIGKFGWLKHSLSKMLILPVREYCAWCC